MKKLTRKLFVSIMTLVLTAMALGTTTFAWFSMNTSVDATTMNVTAKSDALFLLIGDKTTSTADAIQAVNNGNQRSVAGVASQYSDPTTNRADHNVYPAYYATTTTTLHENSVTAEHWYKGSSDNYNLATSGVTLTDLDVATTASNLDGYVVRYDFYLTVSDDSANIEKYVRVSPTFSQFTGSYNNGTTTTVNSDALACVVIINGATPETHNFTNFSSTAQNWVTSSKVAFTHTTVVKVEVLVYINGESEATASANIAALTGALAINFSLQD